MKTFLATDGLEAYQAPPIPLGGCEKRTVDYMEPGFIGGPGVDGLLQAKRTDFHEPAWREIHGVVRETGGGPIAGAIVHAATGAKYHTRAVANAEGRYWNPRPRRRRPSLTATAKGWAVPPARERPTRTRASTSLCRGARRSASTRPTRASGEKLPVPTCRECVPTSPSPRRRRPSA